MTRTLGRIILGLAALAIVLPAQAQADDGPFVWKDGDRVVLIGDTFIERDQTFGYLETLITLRNPDKTITFRNLGWSGDSVRGLSRARFGPPAEGYQHLIDHVLALKPTVLIIGYGMADSFDGEAGLPSFVSGLNATLDALAPTKARLIFLSPIAHEDLGRPLPDPAKHNAALAKYRDAIKAIAEARKGTFVDLYEPTLSAHEYGIDPLTSNGIHLTQYGSWYLSTIIDLDLRKAKREGGWNLTIDWKDGQPFGFGPGGRRILPTVGPGSIKFVVEDSTLPAPPAPPGTPADVVWAGGKRIVRDRSIAKGRQEATLKIDGKPITTQSAEMWRNGVTLTSCPELTQVEELRQAINRKNELYFYRWRPQNETYLFGFRKHEQGNNAREIPLFDPLVEEQEKLIERRRKPVKHSYELK